MGIIDKFTGISTLRAKNSREFMKNSLLNSQALYSTIPYA
jgi:hypothetical protein